MPGTSSHAARPGTDRRAAANVDGYSIVAHNIVADFGRGNAGWIWQGTPGRAPFRFDRAPLPENPPLRNVVVSGNLIEDSERDRGSAGFPARYRRPVRVAAGAGAPEELLFADNAFEPGAESVAPADR